MNKERKTMKKPTFKSFYEDANTKSDTFDDTQLKWIAETIVQEGFFNNFEDMVIDNSWLFRGTDAFRKIMRDQPVYLLKKRLAPRKSIYSKEQFLYNFWHSYSDLPSRRYGVFATFNKRNADMFGEAFIVIPKDSTKLSGVPTDLNISFLDVVQKELGAPSASFGDISKVFKYAITAISSVKQFVPLKHRAKLERQVDELYDLWPSLSNVMDTTNSEFDKWFAAFDDAISMFMTLDFKDDDVDLRLSGRYDAVEFIQKIFKDYISKGKSSKDAILKVLNTVQKSVISTSSVSSMKQRMIDASKKGTPEPTSEIWWEADSLLLDADLTDSTLAKKILKYAQQLKFSK
jgi:hypothetical protein